MNMLLKKNVAMSNLLKKNLITKYCILLEKEYASNCIRCSYSLFVYSDGAKQKFDHKI